jgi:hypothetical protein
MDKTEIEDFIENIKRHGFNVDDFQLNHVDQTQWDPKNIVPIKGKVTVKRKSTKKEKDYSTGHGTHWVADFCDDLKNGFYN